MVSKEDSETDKLQSRVTKLEKQRIWFIAIICLLISSNIILYCKYSQVVKFIEILYIKCFDYANYFIMLIVNYNKRLVSLQFNIEKLFNNRELAFGLWILALLIFIMISKKARPSALEVIKLLLSWKFLIAYACMIVYTMIAVYILGDIGFWNISMLKDTIIWFIFTATVSAFRAIDKGKDIDYFKTATKDYLKITLMFEFIVNMYTFSLLGELFLLPFLCIIGMMTAILEVSPEFQNEKSKPVKKFLEFTTIAVSLYIIYNSVVLALKDINNLGNMNSIKNMLLPPILSIIFLGFAYLFAMWSSYEQIFIRLEFGEKKSKYLIMYIKLKILLLCNINISRVNMLWKKYGSRLLSAKDRAEVLEILRDNKQMDMF